MRTNRRGIVALAVACVLTSIVPIPLLGASPAAAKTTPRPTPTGMWLLAADGGVFTLGGAAYKGSLANHRLNAPVVSIAADPSGRGYWIVASDGGVFTFGNARYFGSTGAMRLNRPIVGIAATPTGRGYWLVASDGGIFTFGDAHFYGSTGAIRLNRPIVGMTPTRSGHGYWLVASDGGVFTFGDARFHGSTGGRMLSSPVVGLARTPGGRGYWIATQGGDVFPFGDAGHFGHVAPRSPAAGLIATKAGTGYWTATQDGHVQSSGAARSLGAVRSNAPIIAIATPWASSGSGANVNVVTAGPVAALTFDDGPNGTYTPQILSELSSAGVPATFFTIGEQDAARPDLISAEARAGNSVEDHTWDHPDLTRLSAADVASELSRTADVIQQATGIRPVCFRPPYEATNSTVVSIAASLGMSQVLWNVDPADWKRPGVGAIVSNVLGNANGQDIVVIMHDGGGDRSQTVAAVPQIIAGLRARGYHFTRLCA